MTQRNGWEMITPQKRFEPGELCRHLEAARLAYERRALRRLVHDLDGVPRGAPLIEVTDRSASSSTSAPSPAAGSAEAGGTSNSPPVTLT